MTALVFNCHYNGLSIIQELGRRGIRVLALDSVRSVGTYSRYAHFRQCPDPLVAEHEFVDFLLKLGPTFHDRPVLFPTNDHWAIAVARHKETLSRYYFPCVADYSVVELVTEKQRFYDWATAKGYPVPRSWRSFDLDSIPDNAFPLAAKPECRRTASNDGSFALLAPVFDRMRLTVLRNRDELRRFASQHSRLLHHFLFQEYIEGLSDCMYTVGVYANRSHEVLGLFSGRKVRGFPPDVGDCTVGQVEAVPGDVKNLVKDMCKEVRYHGIAEFEFKRSPTGEFRLIEINPRSWSWVGITPACGVSLPWIAYCDANNRSVERSSENHLQDGSVKYVKVLADWRNCTWRNKRAGFPQWHLSQRDWRKSLRARTLVFAEFSRDDWMPGLFAVRMFVRSVIKEMLQRISKR